MRSADLQLIKSAIQDPSGRLDVSDTILIHVESMPMDMYMVINLAASDLRLYSPMKGISRTNLRRCTLSHSLAYEI